jgi:hypothetical protein
VSGERLYCTEVLLPSCDCERADIAGLLRIHQFPLRQRSDAAEVTSGTQIALTSAAVSHARASDEHSVATRTA